MSCGVSCGGAQALRTSEGKLDAVRAQVFVEHAAGWALNNEYT